MGKEVEEKNGMELGNGRGNGGAKEMLGGEGGGGSHEKLLQYGETSSSSLAESTPLIRK